SSDLEVQQLIGEDYGNLLATIRAGGTVSFSSALFSPNGESILVDESVLMRRSQQNFEIRTGFQIFNADEGKPVGNFRNSNSVFSSAGTMQFVNKDRVLIIDSFGHLEEREVNSGKL